MKKKILVTGGIGYIGSHTTVELQNAGFEVIIVDNLSNSRKDVLDRIKQITGIQPMFYEIDLLEKEKLKLVFKENKDIAGIIHFAAYKAVGESVNNPLKYYRNNLEGLLNLLENIQEFGVKNIVFSSSCTVYGQPDKLPVDENAPIKKALSPYGNTKQIAEEILNDTIYASQNFRAIALRYFNPIGAHPSALIGELPLGVPDNLIPYITQTAIGLRKELSIYGDDYNTPDGTAIRDYIHVVDLAKAHVIAVERLIKKSGKKDFEIFNLGTGIGYSVRQIVDTFIKVNQTALKYKIVARREGDVEQVWADTSFANKELDWKTELNLDEMLKSAWSWEKNYRTLFEIND